MTIRPEELWTVFHGMVLGALYLLAFSGAYADLTSLHVWALTVQGTQERMNRLRWGLGAMAVLSWLTALSGTLMVYPGYRSADPRSVKSLLVVDSQTAGWHTFGMEWKEHLAWLAPILATAIVVVVWHYGSRLARHETIRRVVLALLLISFGAAAVAGILGAFIDKAGHMAMGQTGGTP